MPNEWGGVRLEESIKTGLAMVVTIGVSLWMDFLEPAWAGFAVAMISLDTAGQSMNKAAMRMLGTLVAFVASLSFIGLFPQQRWAMLLALTPYIGLCTYMLTGKKRQYFWYVCAFVCLTIMVHGGVDSVNAFDFAVARVEETALGILVYSLVSMFLWPRSSRGDLENASRGLFDVQLRLYRAYRELMSDGDRHDESGPLRLQTLQRLSQIGQALNAAEADSYEVWELRHAWRCFVDQTTVLMETLGRWLVSLPEIRDLDLARFFPRAEACCSELDRRFVQIQHMLAGRDAETQPQVIDLELEGSEAGALTHFQKAALALLLTQLRKLDEVSLALFESVQQIHGPGRIDPTRLRRRSRPLRLSLDADRFRSVVSILATMWTSFALWVWLDPPGDAMFWFLATLWAMISLLSRQSPQSLLPGMLLGFGVGGVSYLGVMPHLSGYAELGVLLFGVTAGGVYLFWQPSRRGTKSMYMAMFLIATSIENEQSYSFSDYANTVASSLLALGVAAAVAYFPGSPRPEKVFLRVLARFFRHAELLMSRLAPEPDQGEKFGARWRSPWYRNDLVELPEKLVTLAEQIDCRLLPGTTPEHVRSLVTNVLSLTRRIQELVEAREHVWPDPRLEEVVEDLRQWRLLAQRQFRLWAADPSAALDPAADMSARLHTRLAHIEADLGAARARAEDQGFRVDFEALYRYLGGFRGLSEAAIGYAGVAGDLDWEPWREARF